MTSPSLPTSSGQLLPAVGQIAITVTDLARAVAFYRDVLEIPLLFEAPPALAFFGCGSVRLMLSVPEAGVPRTGTSIIYYRVADLDAVHMVLTKKGVPFKEPPNLVARMPDHDLWMAVCQDSEGNYVGLMSEVRR